MELTIELVLGCGRVELAKEEAWAGLSSGVELDSSCWLSSKNKLVYSCSTPLTSSSSIAAALFFGSTAMSLHMPQALYQGSPRQAGLPQKREGLSSSSVISLLSLS